MRDFKVEGKDGDTYSLLADFLKVEKGYLSLMAYDEEMGDASEVAIFSEWKCVYMMSEGNNEKVAD